MAEHIHEIAARLGQQSLGVTERGEPWLTFTVPGNGEAWETGGAGRGGDGPPSANFARPWSRAYEFIDRRDDLHPYECKGAGACPHCDRAVSRDHHPAACPLCDPAYDGFRNDYRRGLVPTSAKWYRRLLRCRRRA